MNNLVLVLSKLSGKILCISFRDHAGHLDRIVVYTHKSLVVKRRPDLKDNRIAAIWLEIGLPHKRKILKLFQITFRFPNTPNFSPF